MLIQYKVEKQQKRIDLVSSLNVAVNFLAADAKRSVIKTDYVSVSLCVCMSENLWYRSVSKWTIWIRVLSIH